jgi:hypothetical protein
VDAGYVEVIYGSAAGLTSAGSQIWNQNAGGIADVAETGDGFGSSLAVGKLDTDAFGDLVIGVAAEDVGALANAGVVQVIRGSAAGLTSAGSQLWSQDSAGIADAAEAGDRFGASLASGEINGAAGQDVAIGVPGEDTPGGVVDAGYVHALYGSAAGLTSAGSQIWNQNAGGISDVAETGDGFGSAVALGHLNADAFDDLVVGVPNEGIGALAHAGVVHVIPGAAAGLTSAGQQYWSQNSGGVADSAEAGDGFGNSLGS